MKKLGEIIKGIAPTLATAIGGPFAGTATKFIAGKLFGDENMDEQDLALALKGATPEQLGQLKKIDNDFKVEMKQMDVDLQALAVDDRKSARNLAKSTTLWPQIILSTIFIVGYFVILWLLFSGTIQLPDNIRDMANILLGVLTGGIPMILRFWFGGSPDDKDRMDAIYNSTPNNR